MLKKECAALVVVDIQDVLLPKSEEVASRYLTQSGKMIRIARLLDLPILVTEQYPERLGATNAGILELLGEAERLPKMEFGCFGNEAFCKALNATGCQQLLLVGMETHVCVLQTALEALDRGYEVYLVTDALVSSRKSEYKAGLTRMIQAGAIPVSTEMVIFELLRRAGTDEFKRALPIVKEQA